MASAVRIMDNGLAARWAASRTALAGRSTPLAATHDGIRPRGLFVEGELLVRVDDEATMAALRGHDGVVVDQAWEIPLPPEGADPERVRPLDSMPQVAVAHFDGSEVDDTHLARAIGDTGLAVTSRAGAGTLSLAVLLAGEGAKVMPNSVGRPGALPKGSSAEQNDAVGGPNAYAWPEFSGRARFDRAWQLIDAYRQLRSGPGHTVQFAVMDGGFWINPDGSPGAPAGRPPEFRPPVMQWNLGAEGQPASGANQANGPMWHGQWVASLGVAPHDDGAGVAGAGGTVATPWLFKCDLSDRQVIRGVQVATAWGIDVINMSFSIEPSLGFLGIGGDFDEDAFNSMFRWAADNGVIIVCGAGNDGRELPNYDLRPATRTPGTVTVGALDGDVAWGESNYGSSVDIWAQGVNVHVGPIPGTPSVTRQSGTSGSAPIVAGAVAMLKFVDPTLRTPDVLRILKDTGWRGSPDPKVPVGLDAAAALWAVLGRRLPDDLGEPDGGPGAAKALIRQPDGSLTPSSVAARALSRPGDADWYVFRIDDFTQLTVTLDYAAGLGPATVALIPDDAGSRAGEELVDSRTPGHQQMGPGLVAPGTYRLRVFGGVTIYELKVQVPKGALAPDIFEPNDTSERATSFTLAPPPKNGISTTLHRHAWRAGSFELCLHRPDDVDYLEILDIPTSGLTQPIFTVWRTDAPVDVALLDPDGAEQRRWHGRDARVVLPQGRAMMRVSGPMTRYTLRLGLEFDRSKLPGPYQEVDLSPLPLGGDPWPEEGELHGWERYFQVLVDDELSATPGLRLSGPPGLTMHLLDELGTPVAAAQRVGDGELRLDVAGVAPGDYVLRIGRAVDAAARLAPGRLPTASFRIGPIL